MSNPWIASAVVVASAVTLSFAGVPGGQPTTCENACGARADEGLAAVRQRVRKLLRYQTFMALPQSHRESITARLGVEDLPRVERDGESVDPWVDLAPQPEESYRTVSEFVDRDTFYRFEPIHQRMLVTIAERIEQGIVPPGPCFKPDTDDKLVAAFQAAMQAGIDQNGDRFQQTTRWGATALNPGGTTAQGSQTTLTYSYVPDGTFVPNLIGVSGNSDLQAWLNGIYGSPATWQTIFDEVFTEWGNLSGVTYVYEPNDDGVNLNSFSGSPGVRGDLRIAGIFIDGNSGTLAYNNFPQDGDMVFDSGDNFYNNLTNNSQGFRNVAYHEHGHGFGALHVCPITQTKLMEPFISFNFFGPQLDDVLNIQRHYGDQNEPDNSAGQATSLGTLSNGTTNVNSVSSDDNSDEDWFSFTVTAAKEVAATMTPFGGTYDSSPQSGSCGGAGNCCSGNIIDTRQFNDLGIEIIDTNGVNVLVSANANGLGVADTAQINVPSAGTYYVRIFSGSSNNVQMYSLDITIGDPAFVPPSFDFPGGLPAAVDPGVPTVIDVTLDPGDDTVFPGSETFFYRFSLGAYTTVPLTDLGGGNFQATLPGAACDDSPEFYFQANAIATGVFTDPVSGGFSPYTALVGSVSETLADDAETDIGWTVAGTATDGLWDRGVPENNDRGDPPADADGSGQAWLTDNDTTTTNSDVDNGNATLTSPVFDLSSGGTVSWQFWFNDIVGGELNGDSFDVLVSTDGGSNYSLVRTYTTASDMWRPDSIEVGVEVTATSTFVIRFRAEDLGTQNVVEAGLDDFRISELTCIDPNPACSEADVTTTGAGLGDPGYGVPDNAITAADLNYFVNGWVAADTAIADVTTTGAGIGDPGYGVPDGAVTAADLNYFVNVWIVGCP